MTKSAQFLIALLLVLGGIIVFAWLLNPEMRKVYEEAPPFSANDGVSVAALDELAAAIKACEIAKWQLAHNMPVSDLEVALLEKRMNNAIARVEVEKAQGRR